VFKYQLQFKTNKSSWPQFDSSDNNQIMSYKDDTTKVESIFRITWVWLEAKMHTPTRCSFLWN